MARRTAGKRGVVVEITSTRLSEEQRSHARKMRSAKRRKSSYKGHTADALAFSDDEGRGKLRKVMGSRKQALIHGYPNGATRYTCVPSSIEEKPGELKHLSNRRKRNQPRYPQ